MDIFNNLHNSIFHYQLAFPICYGLTISVISSKWTFRTFNLSFNQMVRSLHQQYTQKLVYVYIVYIKGSHIMIYVYKHTATPYILHTALHHCSSMAREVDWKNMSVPIECLAEQPELCEG